MRRTFLTLLVLATCAVSLWSQGPTSVTLTSPNGGETYRPGTSQDLRWDTTGTYRARWRFLFGTSPAGPWTPLLGAENVLDSGSRRGVFAGGFRIPRNATETGYIRMELIADPNVSDNSNAPFTIIAPPPATCDSVLKGEITTRVKLHNTKVYCLEGYVYINDGAVLEIEPGTIILGDQPGNNSALVVNRGGKIVAQGTAQLPIVFTSRAVPGQRARGDWGGILMCGKARTNHPAGQAALEGGVSDATAGGKGWFGGSDDDDSSGVLKYVRIEFAGIATQPNSELNGLTMGGIGRRTVIENVQVSYGNDDAFEWFGGTVNGRNLIAIGTLDDDFDGDNGWRGRVQHGLVQRFRTAADASTSQAFEMDNDATASYNQPLTAPVFSNITAIGPIQDTAWTPGSGANQFSSRFGAAAQIRRNARTSIHNSLFIGWPRGFEFAQVPTMAAALADSIEIRNNSWYGVKGATLTLAGGTPPAGLDATWLAKPAYGNIVDKSSPNGAQLESAFTTGVEFNPMPKSGSPVLTSASFEGNANDAYFDRVDHRGAFGMQRWDLPWAEYDPVNKEYLAQPPVSVREDDVQTIGIAGRAFPNPTADGSTIRYELRNDDAVSIRVMDALGSLSSTFITNAQQQLGVYEFRLVTTDLANGIYYVTISGQRGTITIPVTVAR